MVTQTEEGKLIAQGNFEFLENYRERMFGLARNIVYSYQDAEEVVQETMKILIQRGLRRYDSSQPFEPWVLQCTRNSALTHIRSREYNLRFEDIENHTDELKDRALNIPNFEIIKAESFEIMQANLRRLAPYYREAIEMHYFQRMQYKDIARCIGKPIGTVKRRIHEGIRRLQVMMSELD